VTKSGDASSKWVQKLIDEEQKLDSARRCLQDRVQLIKEFSFHTSTPPLVFCNAKDVHGKYPNASVYTYQY
jgi:hypothetical protein